MPADRLLEWQAGDGWEPICAALDLPVPSQPFPHTNTTADFRTMIGLRRWNGLIGSEAALSW